MSPITVNGIEYGKDLATAAQIAAGTVGPAIDPAGLAAARTAGYFQRLTDYQRVIVVDAGGNGDYTKLSDAYTYASTLPLSSSDRAVILIFGNPQDSSGVTATNYVDIIGHNTSFSQLLTVSSTDNVRVSNVTFSNAASTIRLSQNGHATFAGCRFLGEVSWDDLGVVADFVGCEFAHTLVGDNGTSYTSIVSFYGCIGNFTIYPLLNGNTRFYGCRMITVNPLEDYGFENRGLIEGFGSYFGCLSASDATYVLRNRLDAIYCGVKLYSCVVEAGGIGNISGMNIAANNTIYGIGTTFISSGTGVGVIAAAPITDVELMHCVLDGGATNVTCATGTANGTSVTI